MLLIVLERRYAHATHVDERHLVVGLIVEDVRRLAIPVLLVAVPRVELAQRESKLFEHSHQLRHLVTVPLVGDQLGKAFTADLPHHDEVVALCTTGVQTREHLAREGHLRIADDGRVLSFQLEEVFHLRQNGRSNPVAPDQFEDQLCTAAASCGALRRVTKEPDAVIEASAEARHFLDGSACSEAELGHQLLPDRRLHGIESPVADVQLLQQVVRP